MNIFEYNQFKDDVELFFVETLNKFDMYLNNSYASKDQPIQNYVFIENENCVIRLDNLESFPYPDVTYKFAFKNNKELTFINESTLRRLLKIDEQFFINYITKSNYESILPKSLAKSERSAYLISLIGINDFILKFYTPLLAGKITKDDYDIFSKDEII